MTYTDQNESLYTCSSWQILQHRYKGKASKKGEKIQEKYFRGKNDYN